MKTIEQLAKEVGGVNVENLHRSDPDLSNGSWVFEPVELERFAALVRAQALKQAAQLCIDKMPRDGIGDATPFFQLVIEIQALNE